ncbi:hypothetical protein EI94DRAFT_1713739 [Lactarius quietus]|nr:hypothetical protein EI94DRAFT_1713739 [Lactarius quietus]
MSLSDEPASAHSQTALRPLYLTMIAQASVASPHDQTPSRTQLSSNRPQPSFRVPSCVHTASKPPPPTVVQVISSDPRPEELASVEDLDFCQETT